MLPVECVVRGYITGSGWKDYQATGTRLGHRAAGRPAGVRAAAVADLHAVDEGRRGPRRGDRLRPRRRARGRPRAHGAGAQRLDRAVPLRRRPCGRARRAARRHEVRVRARPGRRARRRRRGAHAGLVALLAGRRLRAGARAAELRQAVRARLGQPVGVGQDAARARDPRRRRRRRRASATSRPTSASRASRSRPGWSARHEPRPEEQVDATKENALDQQEIDDFLAIKQDGRLGPTAATAGGT